MAISWPEFADQDAKNPKFIEKFLRAQIHESQVTLLGELDLTSPTNYGNTQWSLAELAEYLIEKPVIGSNLTKSSNEVLDYAATIVIWAVSRAQNLEDGTELWKNSVLPEGKLSKVAEKFTLAISELNLETFQGMLEGRQRHITLARLHAMIPIYATNKFVEAIRIAHKFHRPKEITLQNILDNETIPVAVKLLFQTEREIALDLIERSMQVLSTGKNSGLPKRLTDALLKDFSPVYNKKGIGNLSPSIIFSESESDVYLGFVPDGWRVVDQNANEIDALGSVSLGTTLALGPSSTSFRLLDTARGFLLFNFEGRLQESNYMPSEGGIIIHSRETLIDDNHLSTERIPMANWQDWHWAIVRPDIDITIRDKSGKEHLIRSKRGIQVEESFIPNLFTSDGATVSSGWPTIGSNQIVRAIDNVTGNEIDLIANQNQIQNGSGGLIDVSVFGGMGKSRNINQLVIPGLVVENIDRPLTNGERREIRFKFPHQWSGPEVLIIDGGKISEVPHILVKDPQGHDHKIMVHLPILNWTVEFENQEIQKMYSLGRFKLEESKKLKSLVLHDSNTKTMPNLKITEVSKDSIGSRVAISHGNDFRFDLRTLRDSNEKKEIRLDLVFNDKTINLCSFQAKQNIVIKDPRDLEAATKEIGMFTEDDWKNLRIQQAKEAAILQLRKRSFRRNYR